MHGTAHQLVPGSSMQQSGLSTRQWCVCASLEEPGSGVVLELQKRCRMAASGGLLEEAAGEGCRAQDRSAPGGVIRSRLCRRLDAP
jgi:hypothetical protein